MPDPNFLIIGAQKAATTWLANMTGQHPDAFIARKKEVHFFNKRENYAKGIEWYRSQFSGSTGQKAIGEATPNYLWTSESSVEIEESNRTENIPLLVHTHYPDIKLIVSLRNPVDRAVSAFIHHIRLGRVSPRQRIADVWNRFGIKTMGFYAEHLRHWGEHFDLTKMFITVFETGIRQDRSATVRSLFEYLDVDPGFVPKKLSVEKNVRRSSFVTTMFHVNKNLGRVAQYTPLVNRLNVPRIEVSDDERRRLYDMYVRDIEDVERMLGLDLRIWRRSSAT